MLNCSGQQLDVTYELKGVDGSSFGIIRLLNVVCEGNTEEVYTCMINYVSCSISNDSYTKSQTVWQFATQLTVK